MHSKHERPVHGGLNYAELESLGLRPEEVTDFSASINPLGPSQVALEAAQRVNLAAYPDPDCLDLRRAIGNSLDIDPENVLPGNGSTELIHLLARAFLAPDNLKALPPGPGTGGAALIFAPTFGEYVAACRTEGVEPVSLLPQRAGQSGARFLWDIPGALDSIADHTPAIVFLCNPNNPTGVYLGEDQISRVAEALQGFGLLVLDEAYLPFVRERWNSVPLLSLGNVVLLRSMTKDYALTGLRLGYVLAPEDIVIRVRRFQYSWSVNAAAQAAGIAALADHQHVENGKSVVDEGKEHLRQVASDLGIESPPAAANFLLFNVGSAREVRKALLLQHRICVRDCTSFGLPEYIRIGVRTMEDNRRLAEALRSVLPSLSQAKGPFGAGRDAIA